MKKSSPTTEAKALARQYVEAETNQQRQDLFRALDLKITQIRLKGNESHTDKRAQLLLEAQAAVDEAAAKQAA